MRSLQKKCDKLLAFKEQTREMVYQLVADKEELHEALREQQQETNRARQCLEQCLNILELYHDSKKDGGHPNQRIEESVERILASRPSMLGSTVMQQQHQQQQQQEQQEQQRLQAHQEQEFEEAGRQQHQDYSYQGWPVNSFNVAAGPVMTPADDDQATWGTPLPLHVASPIPGITSTPGAGSYS